MTKSYAIWPGGANPAPGSYVDIIFTEGNERLGVRSDILRWRHRGIPGQDITAWRLSARAPVPLPAVEETPTSELARLVLSAEPTIKGGWATAYRIADKILSASTQKLKEESAVVLQPYDSHSLKTGDTVWVRATAGDVCTSCCAVLFRNLRGEYVTHYFPPGDILLSFDPHSQSQLDETT